MLTCLFRPVYLLLCFMRIQSSIIKIHFIVVERIFNFFKQQFDSILQIVFQNGLSPLGVAAREGYAEIASMLIQIGAYVNCIDRVISSSISKWNY